MGLVKISHKIDSFFSRAALNIEAVRDLLFNILLIISAVGAFLLVFGGQQVFIRSGLVIYNKIIIFLWIIFHIPLYFIGRTKRRLFAYLTYLYLGFLLVSVMFQISNFSYFERVVLQFPITYSLLFIALLLLPYNRYFRFSSLICSISVIWIIIIHDKLLPQHGVYITISFVTQIIGHWLLGILVSRIMQQYNKKIIESRAELADHNKMLKEEVAANVKMIKKQQEQLYQAQKLEALGQMAGGLAHDFNNYLTAILGFSKLAVSKVDKDSPVYKNIIQIIRAGDKSTALTKQLLLFSRKQPMNPTIIDINETIKGLLKMLYRLIREDISIQASLAKDINAIRADEANIEQVIVNLVVNARDAMPDGGTLTIRTENVTISKKDILKIPNSKEGMYVCLSIEDNGTGMDPETRERIFEPFFTTKEPGKGTGLGLSVIYGIVTEHNGWVNVDSKKGRGTIFKIYLMAEKLSGTIRKEYVDHHKNIKKLCGQGEHILVVEDQKEILDFCETTLNENGYQATGVGTIEEALKILKLGSQEYKCVITDLVLPGKSGFTLIDEIKKNFPSVGVVMSSGYSDKKEQCEELIQNGVPFLQKPFGSVDLLEAIQKCKKLRG